MKRTPKKGSAARAEIAKQPLPDPAEIAKQQLEQALEGGKAPAAELAESREQRIDRALEADPDWPARQAAWKRLCERLGITDEATLDARRLEHEHWEALERQRHGDVDRKIRELWQILNDPDEF